MIRPRVRSFAATAALMLAAGLSPGSPPAVAQSARPVTAQTYDLVIAGGRVIDPETGFDGVANVGIRGGRVEAVTAERLDGARVIDARGRVVAPGFIDILAGGFTLEGNRYKATDGVTSIFAMHGGPVNVGEWYARQEAEGRLIHYGTTVGHGSLRQAVGIEDREGTATPEQLAEMVRLAKRSLRDGAVGIGFGVQYVPGASEDEVIALFEVCAEYDVGCHLHTRFLGPRPPENSVKGFMEVIAAAAATGASAQIVHINSVGGREMDTALKLVEGARAHGIDVMADAYPWEAGSTALESAVFDPGWQERMAITYEDIELTKTGERLTEETFRQYREDGEPTSVVIFFVPEEGNRKALQSPVVMVASDGGISDGRGHPRGAGTFGLVLRKYVRENGWLSLPEAIGKMTYMPAVRLQSAVPEMRRKGRLSPGADADIVVFDPDRVRERATYAEPAQYSEGFDYVLVAGVPVVDGGRLVEDARPGKAMRGAR